MNVYVYVHVRVHVHAHVNVHVHVHVVCLLRYLGLAWDTDKLQAGVPPPVFHVFDTHSDVLYILGKLHVIKRSRIKRSSDARRARPMPC